MKKQFRKTVRFVMTHKSAVVIGIVAVTVVGRQQREIERLHEELEKFTALEARLRSRSKNTAYNENRL